MSAKGTVASLVALGLGYWVLTSGVPRFLDHALGQQETVAPPESPAVVDCRSALRSLGPRKQLYVLVDRIRSNEGLTAKVLSRLQGETGAVENDGNHTYSYGTVRMGVKKLRSIVAHTDSSRVPRGSTFVVLTVEDCLIAVLGDPQAEVLVVDPGTPEQIVAPAEDLRSMVR